MATIEKSYKNKGEYVLKNECDIYTCKTSKPLFCSEQCFSHGAACQFAKYLTLYSETTQSK